MRTGYIERKEDTVTVGDLSPNRNQYEIYFVGEDGRTVFRKTIQYRVYRSDGSLDRGGVILSTERLNEVITTKKEEERIEFFEVEHETGYVYG